MSSEYPLARALNNLTAWTKKVKEIVTKILAHSPKTYIICSSKSAMEQCQKVLNGVLKQIQDYEVESYKTDIKEVFFLKRIPPKTSGH